MEKFETNKPEIRKSEKYKSFPGPDLGWGEEMRKNHPDQLTSGIMARIRHISSRIDTYLPSLSGGDNQYNVDKTVAVELENSFDELAQLYLECAKEGHGGTIFPLDDNHSYPFDTIQAIDSKLEEIHHLIIEAENPLFEEKNSKDIINEEDKKVLHEKGINMLKEALMKIKSLKEKLESKSVLA